MSCLLQDRSSDVICRAIKWEQKRCTHSEWSGRKYSTAREAGLRLWTRVWWITWKITVQEGVLQYVDFIFSTFYLNIRAFSGIELYDGASIPSYGVVLSPECIKAPMRLHHSDVHHIRGGWVWGAGLHPSRWCCSWAGCQPGNRAHNGNEAYVWIVFCCKCDIMYVNEPSVNPWWFGYLKNRTDSQHTSEYPWVSQVWLQGGTGDERKVMIPDADIVLCFFYCRSENHLRPVLGNSTLHMVTMQITEWGIQTVHLYSSQLAGTCQPLWNSAHSLVKQWVNSSSSTGWPFHKPAVLLYISWASGPIVFKYHCLPTLHCSRKLSVLREDN